MVNNYRPYDPNEDEERSSAESYLPPKKVSRPTPSVVEERASDPYEDVSPVESYVQPPEVVEAFRESIPDPVPLNEDYFINVDERIINPQKLQGLKDETDKFIKDDSLLQRQIDEYDRSYAEIDDSINIAQEKIDEAESELDDWFDSFSPEEKQSDQFWDDYNKKWEAITPLYDDRDKKIGILNTFVGEIPDDTQPLFLGDRGGNYQFLEDRIDSVGRRGDRINREWASIGDDPFYYPPEIGSSDDRDIFGPNDFAQTDEDRLDQPIVYEDLAEDERFVEALGDRETGTFQRLPQKEEEFILETGGDVYNRDIPTVPPAFAFTDTDYEKQQADPFLPERERGSGAGIKGLVGGAKFLSDALMITRVYEAIKNVPNFEFLNVDMSGEINPYTGLPVEIKKKDEDKGWTDIDDYAIGLGVMGYSIARKTPVGRTVEQVINTFKPAQNQLGFSFDRNSDRNIYQNYIKPLAIRPDSYRNEKPFGDLGFFSEEDQEQLELYKLRGRSVSPLDDNYNYNMMTLQLSQEFQPIDLALTIAQVGFLASLTRLGIRGLVGSIRNAPARINQGRKLIQRNIPDRFLSADNVANKILAKAYITERKKTEQLNFLVNQLTKVQKQSEKIINKPKDWVFMKTLGKGKTPVEFHQEIIQNVINATKANSLGAVKQRLNKLVRDNKATPKQREVLDKLDQELPLTKAETNVVNPVHTKWLNGEDLRYFNSRDPIFRSSLDDSNTFLKLDEQHKIRTNLDYLEKRYGNADFWNKLSQEQKEQFALGIIGQKKLVGKAFDFDGGTIGAGKLPEESLYDPDNMRFIESVLDLYHSKIPSNKNFKSYEDIIYGSGKDKGLVGLISDVKGFGKQYIETYNLDELAKIVKSIDDAVFTPSNVKGSGQRLLTQIKKYGRGTKTPKDTLKIDESKLEDLVNDLDDWLKASKKDGKFRRRVDDEFSDIKSEVFKDSSKPFFSVNVKGTGGAGSSGSSDFSTQGSQSKGSQGQGGDRQGSGSGSFEGSGQGTGEGSGQGTGTGNRQGFGQGSGRGSGPTGFSGQGTGTGQGTGRGTGQGSGQGQGAGTVTGQGEGTGQGGVQGSGQGQGSGRGRGTGQATGTGQGQGQGTGAGRGSGSGSGRGTGSRGTGRGQGIGRATGRGRGTGRGAGGRRSGTGKPEPTKPKKVELPSNQQSATKDDEKKDYIKKLYPQKVQWKQSDDLYITMNLNSGDVDVSEFAVGSGVKSGTGKDSMKVIKRGLKKPKLLRSSASSDEIKMDDVERFIIQQSLFPKRNLRFK